mmetsp:Transcript_127270/g.407349  ORF Transcript_127270/g.407349 Transcript_127270/m.407349 type:complete len:209 (+) Transcript_127270:2584-3210(+)
MNILVVDTKVLAWELEVSQAWMAFRVSSRGSSSTPMRKGPSASAAFPTASWTALSLSPASPSMAEHCIFSAPSLNEAFSCAILASDFPARSSNFSNSLSTAPADCTFFWRIIFMTIDNPLLAFCTAASAASMPWPLSFIKSVASSALSHSTSAGVSLLRMSATTFCAACICANVCLTPFNGFSFVWAPINCCISLLISSVPVLRTFSL